MSVPVIAALPAVQTEKKMAAPVVRKRRVAQRRQSSRYREMP